MPILTPGELLAPAAILAIYCALLRLTAETRAAADVYRQAAWASRLLLLTIADALFVATLLAALGHYALGSAGGLAALLAEAARWLFGLGVLAIMSLRLADWRRQIRRFREEPGASLLGFLRDD